MYLSGWGSACARFAVRSYSAKKRDANASTSFFGTNAPFSSLAKNMIPSIW
jgi:hypothetical protein